MLADGTDWHYRVTDTGSTEEGDLRTLNGVWLVGYTEGRYGTDNGDVVMSDKAQLDRQQSRDFESVVQTRQDRGIIFAGGGVWNWNAVTGVLSWDDTIQVFIAGLGTSTIAAGSATGISSAGDSIRVILNRATAGALTSDKQAIGDGTFDTDDGLLLGVRGGDDRFYLRDGTTFSTGESKRLGVVQTLVDRVETVSFNRQGWVPGHEVAVGVANGQVNGGGTNFFKSGANFTVLIPNTGGDPDTPPTSGSTGMGSSRSSPSLTAPTSLWAARPRSLPD